MFKRVSVAQRRVWRDNLACYKLRISSNAKRRHDNTQKLSSWLKWDLRTKPKGPGYPVDFARAEWWIMGLPLKHVNV